MVTNRYREKQSLASNSFSNPRSFAVGNKTALCRHQKMLSITNYIQLSTVMSTMIL